MDEMEMDYTFEKTVDGNYQVRLHGEFVCYCNDTDENVVDGVLSEMGYKSRLEFLEVAWGLI